MKFGDLELSHRLGEHCLDGNQGEKVTDYFSVRLNEEWGCKLSAPGLEKRAPPFSSPPLVLKVFREQNTTE